MRNYTIYLVYASLSILLVVVFYGINISYFKQNLEANPANKGFEYRCELGKTAYQLLERNFTVNAEDSSLGKMVKGINNIDSQKDRFWAFYIDGNFAPVGAESYICKGQEKIEWRLEKIQ